MYDHVDLRCTNIQLARPLYDVLIRALGLTHVCEDPESVCWYDAADPKGRPFFGLILDPNHKPTESRIAFRASGREQVDRLAEAARQAGARRYEAPHLCTEYTPQYYAAFFEDADGNKLEICYRS